MASIPAYQARTLPRRKPEGAAAVLLPFDTKGNIAEEAFAERVRATHAAGLRNAVNMDTGYANYLTTEQKRRVLALTRQALGPGVDFIAGAYIEGLTGDAITLYRREIEAIGEVGATPILFQTTRLHGKTASEVANTYALAVAEVKQAIAFELGKQFAPNGEIWDDDTVRAIMQIPAIRGMKHSSLSVALELQRLELRDRERPDFRIYTGNDLGIRMTEYGSDYLLGLAAFCPERFAERDRLWLAGDPAYYDVSEAIQYLGAVAFRAPVPAYKHSLAVFLHMRGLIPTSAAHPNNPLRPDWEPDLLADCAHRLGLAVTR